MSHEKMLVSATITIRQGSVSEKYAENVTRLFWMVKFIWCEFRLLNLENMTHTFTLNKLSFYLILSCAARVQHIFHNLSFTLAFKYKSIL